MHPATAHCTLHFLGEVGNDEIEPIDGAARNAAARSGPAKLEIAGLRAFPRPSNPRVVWIDVRGQLEPLELLQQQLGAALAELGFEPNRRDFRPHVTLGRVRGRRGLRHLRDLLERHRDTRLGSLDVRRFVLLRSRTVAFWRPVRADGQLSAREQLTRRLPQQLLARRPDPRWAGPTGPDLRWPCYG